MNEQHVTAVDPGANEAAAVTSRAAFYEQKYESTIESFQPFKRKLLQLFCKEQRGGRVLDVGCGSGVIGEELSQLGCEVFGIDIAHSAVVRYAQGGRAGFMCDLEQGIPLASESFDAIWISEVIEHVVNFEALLHEIRRVLKPNGRFYLSTPNSAYLGYRIVYLIGRTPTELQHPYHVRFFSFGFLEEKIASTGLNVATSIGQNTFAYVPNSLVRTLDGLPRAPATFIEKILNLGGVRRVPGLIRGEKMLGYWFGRLGRSMMSISIILVGVK